MHSESGKFLLPESRILGFGIWNTAQEIWNLTNQRYGIQVSLTKNPGTKEWNPEYKIQIKIPQHEANVAKTLTLLKES